jgi:hypothetical protein
LIIRTFRRVVGETPGEKTVWAAQTYAFWGELLVISYPLLVVSYQLSANGQTDNR